MAQDPSIFYASMADDVGAAKYYVEAGQPVDITDTTHLVIAPEFYKTPFKGGDKYLDAGG